MLENSTHFLNPHSSFVKPEGCGQVRQVSRQAPGFFFTYLPYEHEVRWTRFLLGQIPLSKPDALSRLLDVTLKGKPSIFPVEAHQRICLLP